MNAKDVYFQNTTFVIVFLILIAGFSINFVNKLALNDDNLYLYHSVSTVVDANESAIEEEGKILEEALSGDYGSTDEFSSRWKMRSEYSSNYLISLYVYKLGESLAKSYQEDNNADAYVDRVLSSFYLPVIVYGLFFATLLYFFSNQPRVIGSVLILLLIVYLTNEFFPRGGQNFFDYGIVNFIKFCISPGYGLTPLGFTPRNHMMLLSIPFFLVWLRSNLLIAYAGIFLLLLVHNSMAFLILPFIVFADLLVRPKQLFKLEILMCITSVVLVYFSREHLFEIPYRDFLFYVGVIILMLSLTIGFKRNGIRLSSGGEAGNFWDTKTIAYLALAIIGIWFVVLLAMYFFSYFLPGTTFPVWYIFPGRSLAVLRPFLMVSIILIAFNYFIKSELQWKQAFYVSLAVLSIVLTSGVFVLKEKMPEFKTTLKNDLERLSVDSKNNELSYIKDNEKIIYYRLVEKYRQ